MSNLETVLRMAGVDGAHWSGGDTVLGRLRVAGVGAVRVGAVVRDGRLCVQAQHDVPDTGPAGTRALEQYLALLREQVRDPGFAAGRCADRGVVWLSVSGAPEDARVRAALLVALARLALQPLDALARSAELAGAYLLQSRDATPPTGCSPEE